MDGQKRDGTHPVHLLVGWALVGNRRLMGLRVAGFVHDDAFCGGQKRETVAYRPVGRESGDDLAEPLSPLTIANHPVGG